MSRQELKDHKLLDAIIKGLDLKNDSALSKFLGVPHPTISKVRNGHTVVTDYLRIRIMRTTGWPLSRIDDYAPPHETPLVAAEE